MLKRNNVWNNLDWLTVFLYLFLVFLGWINIYASVYETGHQSIFDLSQYYGKQLLWIVAALLIAFIILLIETNFYVFFSYVIYTLIILLLILVLLAGTEINNSKSWLTIGNFGFQPSEFGKFATGLALAKYMSSFGFKLKRFKSLAFIAFIVLLPVFLIFLQNDAGSAVVYFSFILVLYREGLSEIVLFFSIIIVLLFLLSLVLSELILFSVLAGITLLLFLVFNPGIKYFITVSLILAFSCVFIAGFKFFTGTGFEVEEMLATGLLVGGVIVFVYSLRNKINKYAMIALILTGSIIFSISVDYVYDNVLEPYQQARINELVGIERDPVGSGYNVNQSKIAIGSGGLWGKGFLNGTQTKFNFVPEQSTDFIFCTVGEEWGFAGTFIVVILFMIFFIRLIRLAERQRSSFSRIYGYSVTAILFFHFIVNIGMTIGIMPVIGIPLPFFSYGGSSLWSFTILLFIFLRLDASRLDRLSG